MSASRGPVPPVLAEIRYRRVWKVVVAYLALAFATIEAATTYLPALGLPEWVWRAVLGTVVLGFPVAVVLSWTYDITPTGVVRTPAQITETPENPSSRTWLVLSVVGVAIGVWLHLGRG